MVSGIPLVLGLGARMSDACIYVIFCALKVYFEVKFGYGSHSIIGMCIYIHIEIYI